MKGRLNMKKSVYILISFLIFTKVIYADSSDRFIVFYLGGGVNGSFVKSSVTELVPTSYNSNYPQNNPSININSSSNIVNAMCKSGTCNLNSLGGGISGEAGIKLRPSKFLEFDLWLGLDYSHTFIGDGVLPNSIPLKDADYNYLYTYKVGTNGRSGEFAGVNSWLNQLSLNATATFRLWRFGFTGGVGLGGWIKYYNVTLKNIFGDEKDKKGDIGGGTINLILGLSYVLGNNKGEEELLIRFVMPYNEMIDEKGHSYNGIAYGDNGYVNYHEKVAMRPYMINIMFRKYF